MFKKLIATTAVAILAASTLFAAGTANAQYRGGWHEHHNNTGAFVAGVVVGALVAPSPVYVAPPAYGYYMQPGQQCYQVRDYYGRMVNSCTGQLLYSAPLPSPCHAWGGYGLAGNGVPICDRNQY